MTCKSCRKTIGLLYIFWEFFKVNSYLFWAHKLNEYFILCHIGKWNKCDISIFTRDIDTGGFHLSAEIKGIWEELKNRVRILESIQSAKSHWSILENGITCGKMWPETEVLELIVDTFKSLFHFFLRGKIKIQTTLLSDTFYEKNGAPSLEW